MDNAMTDAQKDALNRISDILREHFQSGICVVGVETEDGRYEQTFHTMHGGMAQGIGLLELGKMGIYRNLGNVRREPGGE